MDFFSQMQEILIFAKTRYGNNSNISISENPERPNKKYTIAVGSNGIYMSWSAETIERAWQMAFNEANSYNNGPCRCGSPNEPGYHGHGPFECDWDVDHDETNT